MDTLNIHSSIDTDLVSKTIVAQLLFNTLSQIIVGIGDPSSNAQNYIDHYLGDTYVLNRDQLRSELMSVTTRVGCGRIHEFALSPDPELRIGVRGPAQCIWMPSNPNCAHSRVLGLILRAVILTGKESEAMYYLGPSLHVLIADTQFQLMVQMGNQIEPMGRNGLLEQEKLGNMVVEKVRELLLLLA